MRTVRHIKSGSGLAGMFLFASLLSAAPGSFDRPSSFERLEPGQTVVAAWSLDPSAERGVDEAELVLSLDGGVTYPIRLTGRIAPGARDMAWRVPALPTDHARLALRAGLDERADEEELLFVSDPFSIASPGTQPAEELFAVNDEWRTREALEGAPVRPTTSTCQSPGPEIEVDPLDADEADDAGSDDALMPEGAAAHGARDVVPRPAPSSSRTAFPAALREAPGPLRL